MKEIPAFIKAYYHEVNKQVLVLCTLYVALLVWLNYAFQMEDWLIGHTGLPIPPFTGHFIVYTLAFLPPYLLSLRKKKIDAARPFWICLLFAPAIFAFKVTMDTSMHLSIDAGWNNYWNDIIYWPMRMLALLAVLVIFRFLFHRENGFYGLSTKKFSLAPYIMMLMMMLPLIAAASAQQDFLAVYPKLKNILPLPEGAEPAWLYKLLFELSYGSDFFSVEIFFRGFLIVGFIKWAGKEAILPMACFYCSIHFGKPLGECISSYFGGLLLGIVSFHTRSIYGGLIVHLGIAWLMELGGYLGAAVVGGSI
jgi:hypothetical protein